MKTQAKLAVLMIAILLVAFTSCKNNMNPKVTVKGDGITAGEQLNISVYSDDNLVRFSSNKSKSARTIVADSFDLESNLKYFLWGEAETSEILEPKEVEIDPDASDNTIGKIILDIDCLNWDLTLAAVKTEDVANIADPTDGDSILEQAVLKANSTVDMMFTNVIKFTLSPKGLKKPGTIKLTLNRELVDGNPWKIPAEYKSTAYIYDLTTGEKINSVDGNDLSTLMADYKETTPEDHFGTADYYTANGRTIKPGTYLFQVEFTKDGELRSYVWNDTLIILPGSETKLDITIPNLIGKIPTAPGELKAIINTDDCNVNALGSYTVTFDWNDNGKSKTNIKTELNYALELIELTEAQVNAGIPASDAMDADKWEELEENANKSYKFNYSYFHNQGDDVENVYYGKFYKDGSLLANKYEVTLYLELGKCYLARLFSENSAGLSATAAYSIVDPSNLSDTEKAAEYTTINRFIVTYHLQGGTYKASAAALETTTDIIDYWSMSDAAYDIITPNETAPTLVNGPAPWIYWVTDLSENTKYDADPAEDSYTPLPYTGFKNLDLYAIYSRDGLVEIYKDIKYDIIAEYLSGFEKDDATIMNKTSTQEFSKGELTETTVSVKLPNNADSPAWKYDKVMLEIKYGSRTYVAQEQVGAARGESNEFTIQLSHLPSGYIYNCKISAIYQKTYVSYPFTVYITD